MNKHLEILRTTRNNILSTINGLDLKQLNNIPTGFNNNIAWNLGHVLVTQQLLCYKLSGLECKVDDQVINQYRKGTQPTNDMSKDELSFITNSFFTLIDQTEQDLEKGLFNSYKEYPTSYNFTLHSIEDAIIFNNVHESLHLGSIMALKKLV